MFLDAPKVVKALDKATRENLKRIGAFIMDDARKSIRPRKKRSKPGNPPNSHAGFLRKGILYGFDVARRSLVVGPIRLNQKSGTAPEALEYGGPSIIDYGPNKGKRVSIKARPFMVPAFEKNKDELPGLWKNSVRS